jgi:hypothetical protein
MAGIPREPSFMPTIKCSSCGCEVEISLMGEHICEATQEEGKMSDRGVPASSDRLLTCAAQQHLPAHRQHQSTDL